MSAESDGRFWRFAKVAVQFGWTLWKHGGTDSDCANYPKPVQIWMRPLSWDGRQDIPVGCACCTDLERALLTWFEEYKSTTGNYRFGDHVRREDCRPEKPRVLGDPVDPSFLPAYQAR